MTTTLEQALAASVDLLELAERTNAKIIYRDKLPRDPVLRAVHAQLESEFRRGKAANDTE